MTSRESGPAGIDVTVAPPPRRYNYWLGGKDNYQADRDSGDAVAAVFPTIRIAAEENRRFLRRAVTYLVKETGIRQFLDIGTGIPSAHNTHEVAQSIAPQSRVVYVRDREEFGRFFDGLELVPPGIAPIVEWHNDAAPGQRPSVADTSGYGAVARI